MNERNESGPVSKPIVSVDYGFAAPLFEYEVRSPGGKHLGHARVYPIDMPAEQLRFILETDTEAKFLIRRTRLPHGTAGGIEVLALDEDPRPLARREWAA